MMLWVIIACIPGIAFQGFLFGSSFFITLFIACITAWLTEAGILYLRQKPLKPYLSDASILVAGLLFALCLPPTLPWPMIAFGSITMVILGKHLFGGLGHNIFNPAMIGYVVLLIAYPEAMVQWPSQSLHIDSYTGATPLSHWQTHYLQPMTDVITSIQPNTLIYWQYLNLTWLVGGIILLAKRIISWHIPISFLASMMFISACASLYEPSLYPNPLFQCFTGASMLGAFFIATDPVTAPASHQSKLIYGMGVGFLTLVIRLWGGYPDGLAFAVLMMNMTVPLLDKYIIPKPYGH